MSENINVLVAGSDGMDVLSMPGPDPVKYLRELVEDANEGKLFRMPVQIGATVWCLNSTRDEIIECEVVGYEYDPPEWFILLRFPSGSDVCYGVGYLDEKWFLTKEAAQAAAHLSHDAAAYREGVRTGRNRLASALKEKLYDFTRGIIPCTPAPFTLSFVVDVIDAAVREESEKYG